MPQTIVVEAVTNKFANKYNSGSVMAGGKWMQVSSKIPLSLFQKDQEVSVELETNAKGYTNIVGVNQEENTPAPKIAPKRASKAKPEAIEASKTSYEDNKNRRIQVQGLLQSVIQSPVTINFGDDVTVVARRVLELTDLLIAGMEERL